MDIAIKDGNAGFKDVLLRNQDKVLSMSFERVLDLYWAINKSDPDSTKETIDIPKSEKDIYKLFDKLYNDVSNARLYDKKPDAYLKRRRLERNLFNPETKTIEWHSDETYFDSDDVVKVTKQDESFHIEFTCPEKYEDPYHWGSPTMIWIRFRNSGSFYHPFNVAFMKMFREAQNLKPRGFENSKNKKPTIDENER